MFKSTQEFDSAMKEILVRVRDEKSLDDLLENVDYCDALAECDKREFLKGIIYFINGKGIPRIQECNPRITKSGLYFIESH